MLTTTTRRRRSTRSTKAPLTRASRSHGSCWTVTAARTASGLVEMEATSRGPAARNAPSPRLVIAEADHRRPKPVPRDGWLSRRASARDDEKIPATRDSGRGQYAPERRVDMGVRGLVRGASRRRYLYDRF